MKTKKQKTVASNHITSIEKVFDKAEIQLRQQYSVLFPTQVNEYVEGFIKTNPKWLKHYNRKYNKKLRINKAKIQHLTTLN